MNRSITRGDDVGAEPRAPHLDERRVRGSGGSVPETRAWIEHCGARHAVLQAAAARSSDSPPRQPLVERASPAPVRQYLLP